jgi:hypothetical protein
MPAESSFVWRERIAVLLNALSPFLFIAVMGAARSWFGLAAQPFSMLLQNPMLLVLSALFANGGAKVGLRFLVNSHDPQVRARVRYSAMGVSLTMVVLSIACLIANGGVVNPT